MPARAEARLALVSERPVPQAPQGTPGGIPGLIAAATGSASSDPTQFQPPAGGILGMIRDYMDSNAMPDR
jgi:hypothetical protein